MSDQPQHPFEQQQYGGRATSEQSYFAPPTTQPYDNSQQYFLHQGGHYYPEENQEQFDETDLQNLEEIERLQQQVQGASLEEQVYDIAISEEDAAKMADLDGIIGASSPYYGTPQTSPRYSQGAIGTGSAHSSPRDFSSHSAGSNTHEPSPRSTSSSPRDSSHRSASSTPRGGVLPPGAVPVQNGKLSSQAGEFWFPESRDCACCKGYKHYCKGCGATTCENCLAGGGQPVASPSVDPSSASDGPASEAAQVIPAPSPAATPITAASSPRSGSPRSDGAVCSFYLQGTCTRGASCRFSHAGPVSSGIGGGYGANTSSPRDAADPGHIPSPVGSPRQCVYFLQGNCQFGASCRNAHGAPQGAETAMPPQAPSPRTYSSPRGPATGAGGRGGSYLPPGAVPSQNGVLSPRAHEFWFPESRDCGCCRGFKHGCPCRQGNVTACFHCG